MLLYLSKHSSSWLKPFTYCSSNTLKCCFSNDPGVRTPHSILECNSLPYDIAVHPVRLPTPKGKEAPNPPLRSGLSHSVFPATATRVPKLCHVKNKPLHPKRSTWKLWRKSSDATETGCLVLGGKRWERFCWWLRSTECRAQVWREALHALCVRSSWATQTKRGHSCKRVDLNEERKIIQTP